MAHFTLTEKQEIWFSSNYNDVEGWWAKLAAIGKDVPVGPTKDVLDWMYVKRRRPARGGVTRIETASVMVEAPSKGRGRPGLMIATKQKTATRIWGWYCDLRSLDDFNQVWPFLTDEGRNALFPFLPPSKAKRRVACEFESLTSTIRSLASRYGSLPLNTKNEILFSMLPDMV